MCCPLYMESLASFCLKTPMSGQMSSYYDKSWPRVEAFPVSSLIQKAVLKFYACKSLHNMEFSKSYPPVPRHQPTHLRFHWVLQRFKRKFIWFHEPTSKSFLKSRGQNKIQWPPRLTFEWNLNILEERKLVHDEAIKKKTTLIKAKVANPTKLIDSVLSSRLKVNLCCFNLMWIWESQ